MSENNNIVSLQDQKSRSIMATEKILFYTVPEIIMHYPVFAKHGWTEDDFDKCVSADLFIGKWKEEKPSVVEAEKESLEDFIKFYQSRLNAKPVLEGKTFYTVSELINRYPTMCRRGWMEEEMDFFADKKFFNSRRQAGGSSSLEVEENSFVAFLEYHNQHISSRSKRVEAGLEKFKKPVSKK